MVPTTLPAGSTTVVGSRIYRALSGGFTKLSVGGGTLSLGGSTARGDIEIDAGQVDEVSIALGMFWSKVTTNTTAGESLSVGGLKSDDATRIAQRIRDTAKSRATDTAQELQRLDAEIQNVLDGSAYVRHSAAEPLRNKIELEVGPVLRKVNGHLVSAHLPSPATAALRRLQVLHEDVGFEQARKRSNDVFVTARRSAVHNSTRGVAAHGLTDEQADAIATDEDCTLVLAGAGTGKTAVITGKVAYLVRHHNVPADQILVIAFNKKAAEEVRNRLPSDLQNATVSTFHAFGYDVIGQSTGTKPSLAS